MMDDQRCPQCKSIANLSKNRLVRDSCGHLKCRMCLLEEVDGCVFCRHALNKETEDTNNEKKTNNRYKPNAVSKSADMTVGIIRGWPSNVCVESKNPTVYRCTICNKIFCSRSHVAYHGYCDGRKKPFSCMLCQKEFASKSLYDHHLQVHSGKKPFICDVCGNGFYQRSKLKRHLLLHTGEKSFKCGRCRVAFNNAASLKKHSFIHDGIKPHKCKKCGREFNDSSNLRKHEIMVHSNVQYTCAECGKQYKKKWNLIVHANSHREVRPYPCKNCDKSFYAKKDLIRHQLIHSDEKPYRCTVCSMKFQRKDNVDRHIRNSHPDVDSAGAAEKLPRQNKSNKIPKNKRKIEDKIKDIEVIKSAVDSDTKKVDETPLKSNNIDSIIEANNRRQSVIFSPVRNQPNAELDVPKIDDSPKLPLPASTEVASIDKKATDVELYKKILLSNVESGTKDTDFYSHYIHKKVDYGVTRDLAKHGYQRDQFIKQTFRPPDLSKLESYKNPEPVCTPASIELYKKILLGGNEEETNGAEDESQVNTIDFHWRRRMAHSSS